MYMKITINMLLSTPNEFTPTTMPPMVCGVLTVCENKATYLIRHFPAIGTSGKIFSQIPRQYPFFVL